MTENLSARFWRIARQPRWIGVLVLVLVVAAVFAALAQWQFSRSIDNATTVDIDTETVVPLDDLAQPGLGITDLQLGRQVTVSGALVAGDAVILTGRDDGTGNRGAWLIGHLVTDEQVSLAVALGWAEDADAAAAADPGGVPVTLVGRYLHSEEPQASDFEAGERSAVSVAELINLWAEPGPVYGGYLVARDPVMPLAPITAEPPAREVELNLLNLLYAIEWVVFGGFALYLWYRLVRDEVDRDDDEAAASAAVD